MNTTSKLQEGNASPGLFTTGDIKLTLKTEQEGWVLMNDGTIGDAQSGSSSRADDDTHDLFILLYTQVSNTYAILYDSSGVPAARTNAEADWALHCRLGLTKQMGRFLLVAGAGAGLTAYQLGETGGAQTVALAEANNGPHGHGTHAHGTPYSSSIPGLYGNHPTPYNQDFAIKGTSVENTKWSTSEAVPVSGSGVPHENRPPYAAWNILIKL